MMATTTVQSSPMPTSPNSGKRKRGQADQGIGRDMKVANTNGQDTSAADFSFLHAIQDSMQASDGSAQTAQAALAAPMTHSQYPDSFDTSSQLPPFDDGTGGTSNVTNPMNSSAAQALFEARQQQQTQKPSVGSSAWHQQRKDNHKEVERRRREVINEGIENIAKIVPGAEKNKGAILARTCSYIQELNDKVNKFDNERRLFDDTLHELNARHDNMQRSYHNARNEAEKWQRRCKEAGLNFDDYNIDVDGQDNTGSNGVDGAHDTFDGGVVHDVSGGQM